MTAPGRTAQLTGLRDPARAAAVARSGIIDRTVTPRFDRIAWLIRRMMRTDFGGVGVLDQDRFYWLGDLSSDSDPVWDRSAPIDSLFSQAVVETGEPVIIDDAALADGDDRSVDQFGLRSFIGVPFLDRNGVVLGAVSACDPDPRDWSDDDLTLLEGLAQVATDELSAALDGRAARQSEELLAAVLNNAHTHFAMLDDELCFTMINESMAADSRRRPTDFLGNRFDQMMPLIAQPLTDLMRDVIASGIGFVDTPVVGPARASGKPRRVWSVNCYRLEYDGRRSVALVSNEITEQVASKDRAERLATIAEACSNATSLSDIERVVAYDVAQLLSALSTEVTLWDPDVATDRTTPVGSHPPTYPQNSPAAEAARTGGIILAGTGPDERFRSTHGDPDVGREAVVPCHASTGAVTGLITIRWSRDFGDEISLPTLRTLGGLVGGVAERLNLSRQRDELLAELQTALLAPPPRRPGLDTAVQYLPALRGAGLGGDWVDVVPVGPTTTALVVGDVAGHGPAAAAAMSQVGSTIAQLLIGDVALDELFAEADRVLAARSLSTMATVGIVVVDVESRTLTALSAGHPPPLILRPDGTAGLIPTAVRPPLSTFSASTQPFVATYEPGTKVVLYTDGLIETPSTAIDSSLDGLVEFASTVAEQPLPDLVDELIGELSPGLDDTAVLAAMLA